jgi:hypothetical protein
MNIVDKYSDPIMTSFRESINTAHHIPTVLSAPYRTCEVQGKIIFKYS